MKRTACRSSSAAAAPKLNGRTEQVVAHLSSRRFQLYWLHMNAAVEELRRIHDETLTIDWQPKVTKLNRRLGLSGDDVLSLSIPGLPPFSFNGDVEAIVPGKWILVISLNHQLGGYGADAPQAEGLWDFLGSHNRNF